MTDPSSAIDHLAAGRLARASMALHILTLITALVMPAHITPSTRTIVHRSGRLTMAAGSRVEELMGKEEFDVALSRGDAAVSVVMFTSPICRKCRAFASRFERLAVSEQGGIDSPTAFYSVNSLKNLALFESEGVQTLPTVICYVGRQMVHTHAIGKDTATFAAVDDAVHELQQTPAPALLARAQCAANLAEEQADGADGALPILGALATGGALVRLIAAMSEIGTVAEFAPGAAGLAECAVECLEPLEGLGGAV